MSSVKGRVDLSIEETIATIHLNRPEKKNAMSPDMHVAMHDALDRIEAHGGIKVAVLTGVDEVFCGGMDLEAYFLDAFDTPERFLANLRSSHSWMRRWKSFGAVTLASVNGWCVGGGLLMAALSDLMLVAKEATFCLSEVNFGIFPSGGTTWGVAHNLNPKQALYYMLTAERFDGDVAVELGLANRSVPRAELEATTRGVAEEIASKQLDTLRYVKRVYERVRTMSFPDAQEFEVSMLFELSYRTKNEWVERALEQFRKKQYRPALASYGPPGST